MKSVSVVSVCQTMMRHALAQAQAAFDKNEVPVGCVIARDDQIVASTHNLTRANASPQDHAECLAIRQAQATLGQEYLETCTLYVTLEPCAMCAGAIALARVGRVYYGAYDPKSGGTDHGARVFDHPQCHWKPQVYGGILESECAALLADFFALRR